MENKDLKKEMWSLRGEAVSVGGHVEWILDILAREFASSMQSAPGRQWDDIKESLRKRKLTAALQTELAAMAAYFRGRTRAAHAAISIVNVGESTQIFRMLGGNPPTVDIIRVADLENERDEARDGLAAIQAVARALDADDRAVLQPFSTLLRFRVLGQP